MCGRNFVLLLPALAFGALAFVSTRLLLTEASDFFPSSFGDRSLTSQVLSGAVPPCDNFEPNITRSATNERASSSSFLAVSSGVASLIGACATAAAGLLLSAFRTDHVLLNRNLRSSMQMSSFIFGSLLHLFIMPKWAATRPLRQINSHRSVRELADIAAH